MMVMMMTAIKLFRKFTNIQVPNVQGEVDPKPGYLNCKKQRHLQQRLRKSLKIKTSQLKKRIDQTRSKKKHLAYKVIFLFINIQKTTHPFRHVANGTPSLRPIRKQPSRAAGHRAIVRSRSDPTETKTSPSWMKPIASLEMSFETAGGLKQTWRSFKPFTTIFHLWMWRCFI